MTSEASTCVICLEALVSEKPIGVTAPCGHCLHTECWDGWVASRLGIRDSKCPMCNKAAQSFVRLYVDFGVVADGNDTDSLSLSSADDDGEECDRNSEPDKNDSETAADADKDGEPIVIVIDDNEPELRCRSTRKASANKCTGNNKYKQMAKRLKSRVAAIEVQRKQQGDDHRKLVRELQEKEQHLQITSKQLEEHATSRSGHERTLEGLNLRAIQLKRALDETSTKLDLAEQAAGVAQRQLHDVESVYQRKLARVSASSMNEVQQMKDERPKLVHEIRTLREELLRAQRASSTGVRNSAIADINDKSQKQMRAFQKEAMKCIRAVSDYRNNEGAAAAIQKQNHTIQKEAMKCARAVRDYRTNEARTVAAATTTTKRDSGDVFVERSEKTTTRMSAHATRMRIANKAPGRKQAALAALDARDGMPALEPPILPSFMLAGPHKRRASAPLTASTASQRGGATNLIGRGNAFGLPAVKMRRSERQP